MEDFQGNVINMNKKERLFGQFPPVTKQEWMKKIAHDLKGADFSEKMVWKTPEGYNVMPFYRREDTDNLRYMDSIPGEFPYLRGKKVNDNNWRIRQNIVVTDYASAKNTSE